MNAIYREAFKEVGEEIYQLAEEAGVAKSQKNTAMNMLRRGYTDQQILETTEITPAMLKKCKIALKKEM